MPDSRQQLTAQDIINALGYVPVAVAGAAGTVTIGSVSTIDADQPARVVNVGTASAAILNFYLPKGTDGALTQDAQALLDQALAARDEALGYAQSVAPANDVGPIPPRVPGIGWAGSITLDDKNNLVQFRLLTSAQTYQWDGTAFHRVVTTSDVPDVASLATTDQVTSQINSSSVTRSDGPIPPRVPGVGWAQKLELDDNSHLLSVETLAGATYTWSGTAFVQGLSTADIPHPTQLITATDALALIASHALQAETGPLPAMPKDYKSWVPREIHVDDDGRIIYMATSKGILTESPSGLAPVSGGGAVSQTPLAWASDSQILNAVGDGVTQSYDLSALLHLRPAQEIRATWNGSAVGAAFTFSDDNTLHFTAVPPAGTAIQIVATNGVRYPIDPNVCIILPGCGQSFEYGPADDYPAPAIALTPVYPGQALMPSYGVRATGAPFSTLVDMVEVSATQLGHEGTTPMSARVNHLIRELHRFLPWATPRIIGGVCAHGGFSFQELQRGTDTFESVFVGFVRDAVAAALARGWTPILPVVTWNQGQQDFGYGTTTAQYIQMMRLFKRHVTEVVRRLLPWQTFDPIIVIHQIRNSKAAYDYISPIALADWQLGYEDGFVLAGPSYHIPGPGHPSQLGYNLFGQQGARAIMQAVFGRGWCPVRPDRNRPPVWVDSTHLQIFFDLPRDSGSLVMDTSGVDIGQAGMISYNGFIFRDGVNEATITGHSFPTRDSILLTLSGAPTGPAPKIYYAARYDNGGQEMPDAGGARGNLRADDGDVAGHTAIYPDPGGSTHHVDYDWCVTFALPLPKP